MLGIAILCLNLNRFKLSKEDTLIGPGLFLTDKDFLLNRTQLVQQIEDLFKQQTSDVGSVILAGPGGTGKTTLARLYGRTQQFAVVWEINAERRDSIINSFNDLAFALATTLEHKQELMLIQNIQGTLKKEKAIINFVKCLLQERSNWLLIYDNVENFMEIKDYLPQDANNWRAGKVIITTRDLNIAKKSYIRNSNALVIDELKPNETLELFCKILYKKHPEQLKVDEREKVCDFLNNLPAFPLDIATAAYYLKDTHMTYQEYLQAIKNITDDFAITQETLLKEMGNYTKTRYSIITLSLKRLLTANSEFKEILLLICLLDSQNIPVDLLKSYNEAAAFDNFIYHLNTQALVVITNQHLGFSRTKTFLSIHRSTQEICLKYLTNLLYPLHKKAILTSIVNAFSQYTAKLIKMGEYTNLKIFAVHGESFLAKTRIDQDSANDPITMQFYQILAETYRRLWNSKRACIIDEQAYMIAKRSLGESNVKTAMILRNLGIDCNDLGLYDKAEAYHKKAIAIYKAQKNKDEVEIAVSAISLGITLYDIGKFTEALAVLEESLVTLKKYKGQEENVAYIFGRLGRIHRRLGNYQKAKALLEENLTLFKEQYSKGHAKIGVVLGQLGRVLYDMEDYQGAKSCLEEAIAIYKIHYGEDHVKTGDFLASLGKVLQKLQQYDQAKTAFEKALKLYRVHYGANHIRLAETLLSLGKNYYLTDNLIKAEELFNIVLNIYAQQDYPEAYLAYEALADMFMKKSQHYQDNNNAQQAYELKKQAIDHLKQAQLIVKKHFPQDSTHLPRLQEKLLKIKQVTED